MKNNTIPCGANEFDRFKKKAYHVCPKKRVISIRNVEA
jgi:hypothetical protein